MFFFSKFPVAKDEEDGRLLWLSRSTRCWRPLSCWICSAKPAKAAAVAVARVPARRRTGGWVWLRWLDNFFGVFKKNMISWYWIAQGTGIRYTCIQKEMTISERSCKVSQNFPKERFIALYPPKSHSAPRELTSRRRKRSLRSCGRCPCIARRGIVPIFIEHRNMARQLFDVFWIFLMFFVLDAISQLLRQGYKFSLRMKLHVVWVLFVLFG